MAKPKRKTLPTDFEAVLRAGDLEAMKRVFDRCDVNARGTYAKCTALAYPDCPTALARWLVAHGADVRAGDLWAKTPLHAAASCHDAARITLLIELGCPVDAIAKIGTPLHEAASVRSAASAAALIVHGAALEATMIEELAQFARVMLDAGAQRTPAMTQDVQAIGKRFEFHRKGFNPAYVEATSAALDELYRMFDCAPVARRVEHDGTAEIAVTTGRWQQQHAELWELLVPSSGPAATVQGEVIRISGRIGDELARNGGMNWDGDYRQMARALVAHVRGGTPLASAQLAELDRVVAALEVGGTTDRLAELAVAWVLQNRRPVRLATPAYRR